MVSLYCAYRWICISTLLNTHFIVTMETGSSEVNLVLPGNLQDHVI